MMSFTQLKIAEGTSEEYLQASLNFMKIQKKKMQYFICTYYDITYNIKYGPNYVDIKDVML